MAHWQLGGSDRRPGVPVTRDRAAGPLFQLGLPPALASVSGKGPGRGPSTMISSATSGPRSERHGMILVLLALPMTTLAPPRPCHRGS